MENVSLKCGAREARKRFKNGYWEQFCQKRAQKIEFAKDEGISEQDVRDSFTRQAKSDIMLSSGVRTEDDILYARVVEMLQSDEIVFNPIKRLINEQHFEKLDSHQKEDYVLKLSSKFAQMRERYEREKIG